MSPSRAGDRRRWPDIVSELDQRRVALEIELTTKAPERLRRIVAAYLACRHYDEVRFLVATAPLAKRIARFGECAPSPLGDLIDGQRPSIHVALWEPSTCDVPDLWCARTVSSPHRDL